MKRENKKNHIIQTAVMLFFVFSGFQVYSENLQTVPDSRLSVGEGPELVITRDTAVEMALAYSRELKRSRIDYEEAERLSDYSWNELLPRLNLGAGVNTAGDSDSFSAGENPFNAEYSASLSFSLNPALRENMKQKSLSEEIKKISLEMSTDAVVSSAEKLFYYLLASEKNIEIKEKALSLAEKQYRQTEVNFRNGLASELQLLQSQIAAENRKPGITSAKLDYENTLTSFKDLLGIEKSRTVKLSGKLEIDTIDLDSDKLISLFLDNLPEVKSSEKSVSYNESVAEGIKKANSIPVFSVSGSYKNTLNDFSENLPSTSVLSLNSGEWTDTAALTLSLSWSPNPLLGFSAEKQQQKSAEDSLEKSRLNHADLVEAKEKEIITSVLGIDTYKENLNVSRLNRELAVLSYEMTEESFKSGTAESLEVDEARQEWETAEQNYLTSLYNYRSAVSDLAYLLNTDIETLKRSGK